MVLDTEGLAWSTWPGAGRLRFRTGPSLIRTRTTAQWLELLEDAQVPCAKVIRLADLETDPHLVATGFFQRVETPAGPLRFPGVPVLFDGVRPPVAAPPHLGEHGRAVLAEAGFSADDIAVLMASRAARE